TRFSRDWSSDVCSSDLEPGIAQLADDPSLPAPELESLDVTRGLNGGASCDQMGFMSVKLRWPRGSRFDLNEIGFEYRLVQGSARSEERRVGKECRARWG